VKPDHETGGDLEACESYQTNTVDLSCETLQCDEIWNFVYAKAKNVPESGAAGRVGTYGPGLPLTPMRSSDWFVGRATPKTLLFMMDRTARDSHVQLTTDGLAAYSAAIGFSFGTEVDWAVLQKIYGKDPPRAALQPAVCTGCTSTSSAATRTPREDQHQLRRRQEPHHEDGMRPSPTTNAFSRRSRT
jgi:hypothetical protein